ncbi:hypothetical protein FANTH_8320 [Fusarium anthophilum]|uniref:Actin-like ATPase domain-containing protein n=1 Tax=Fusarium anthophilum TaxID=48485 RepID=A0A8H4ZB21_9HYPO|nr:hypothetical protein FANTH_8320 [Fusarium anthophilum]
MAAPCPDRQKPPSELYVSISHDSIEMATHEANPTAQSPRRLDVHAGIDLGTTDDLPHDLRVSKKLDMAMKEREALDMSAVNVSSKFLGAVWKDAYKEICNRVKDIDKLAQPQVVITVAVPVGWPAALGKGYIRPIKAEATGIAIMSTPLDHQGNLQNSAFQVGDTVIICDCGGGTTDLVSYQVVSLQPFALQETSPGKCIFAGEGVLLNETFLDLVRDKAKRQCTKRTFKDLTNKDYHELMESIWDHNLRTINFPCGESASFLLPVTFLGHQVRLQPRAAPPESLYMTFTADEVNRVFDTVIDPIIDLVKSEMSLVSRETRHQAKHLVMAGGLSSNQYLRDKMRIMANETSPLTNIVWLEGDQGQTAVARGAVYHGIQGNSQSNQPIVQIHARASREGYGLESSADRIILWLVKPGEELSVGGQNRRPVPPQAVRHGRDGCFYVNMYRQEGPNAIPGFASCLSWNAVGELQNLEFNFHWDCTRMHYVLLYQGNQQVPLTIENYYDL